MARLSGTNHQVRRSAHSAYGGTAGKTHASLGEYTEQKEGACAKLHSTSIIGKVASGGSQRGASSPEESSARAAAKLYAEGKM